MLKLHRRPTREPAAPPRAEPPSARSLVSATSVDPERTEDVAAWLRASGTRSTVRSA